MPAHRRPLLLVVCLSALLGPAAAPLPAQDGAKRPMTVDDLMKIRNVSDPKISPDGATVVYVISEVDPGGFYNSDLWRVSVKGDLAVRLTSGPKRDDSPQWSPDGKQVAFLSDRGGSVQVWVIAPDGGEARQLTDAVGGVKDYAWAPDGKSLALLLTDPETDAVKKRKEAKNDVILVDQDYRRNHLHVFEIAAKQTRRLTKGAFHVLNFDWSPDGTRIAYASQPRPIFHDRNEGDVFVVSVADGKVTPLVQRPGQDTLPRWSPDGKQIAFLSNDGKGDHLTNVYLCVVPAAGGKPRNVSTMFDNIVGPGSRDIFHWFPPLKPGNPDELFFCADRGLSRPIVWPYFDLPGDAVLRGDLLYHQFSKSRDGRRIALLVEAPDMPREVFVFEVVFDDQNKPFQIARRVTFSNPQLDWVALANMEDIKWKSKDGLEVEGVLILPPGYKKGGGKLPLLTYIHGGPAFQFSLGFTVYPPGPPQASRYPVHVLAGQGYAIFCPNPRGSAAYGEKFRKANVRDWGGGDFQDIMSGVDHLVAQGVADPERLGVMGWSYGGYMTSWAITQTHRFKAASVGAGVTNLASMYGHTDIPMFMERYFGGAPWKEAKLYADRSAMTFAGNIKTPTLIQHGDKDERVPLAQGQELYAALKRLGVPTEFAVYPGQPHNPTAPRLQRDVLQRNVDWFNRWLKK